MARLENADVQFTKSMSGRPAIFFRDPDANVLEIAEMGAGEIDAASRRRLGAGT